MTIILLKQNLYRLCQSINKDIFYPCVNELKKSPLDNFQDLEKITYIILEALDKAFKKIIQHYPITISSICIVSMILISPQSPLIKILWIMARILLLKNYGKYTWSIIKMYNSEFSEFSLSYDYKETLFFTKNWKSSLKKKTIKTLKNLFSYGT